MNVPIRAALPAVLATLGLFAAPSAHAFSRPDILGSDTLCFPAARHYLTAENKARLDQLASLLRQHPGAAIRLSSYCAGTGMTREYALAYCQRLVDLAGHHLAGQGVDDERIVAVSFGKDTDVPKAALTGCVERVEMEVRLSKSAGHAHRSSVQEDHVEGFRAHVGSTFSAMRGEAK